MAVLCASFVIAHVNWEIANNPAGWRSGEVIVAWGARTDVLLELVEAQRRTGVAFDWIHAEKRKWYAILSRPDSKV